MAESFIDRVSDMSITEMFVNEVRYINLTGRALPFRPIEFGTSLEGPTTRYQGNPESQIQIITSSQDKTTINGRWSGRFINGTDGEIRYGKNSASGEVVDEYSTTIEGPPNAGPVDKLVSKAIQDSEDTGLLDFVNWMHEFVATGPTILFVWAGQSKKGVVRNFSVRIKDTRDIEWSMEFEWNSHKVGIETSVFSEVRPQSIAKSWLDSIKQFRLALEQMLGVDPLSGMYGPNIPLVSDFFVILKMINSTMLQLNAAISEVEKMNEAIARAGMLPMEIARNAIGVLNRTQSLLLEMETIWTENALHEMTGWEYAADALGRKSWQDSLPTSPRDSKFDNASFSKFGLGSKKEIVVGEGGQSVSDVAPVNYPAIVEAMKAGASSPSLSFDMRLIIRIAKYGLHTALGQLNSIVKPKNEFKSIEIAHENQHIGTIASKHYGSWNMWPSLAEYNSLTSPLLPAGTIVLVPENLKVYA